MALQFIINGFSGPMCSVSLDHTCRPQELYEAVETATGIPVLEQRLFAGTEEVHFHEALDHYAFDEQPADLTLFRHEDPFCTIHGFVMEADELCFEQNTTIAKAKSKCLRLPDCQGFFVKADQVEANTFVDVSFKSRNSFKLARPPSYPGDGICYMRMESAEDFERVLEVISEGVISNAPKSVLSDASFMRQAVLKHGHSLSYASEDLREDPELVLLAVQNDGSALLYASTSLRENRNIVSEAVKQNGLALAYASDSLKSDRIIVLSAVQQNGLALKYASRALSGDLEIIVAAVENKGCAFQYVPEEVRGYHNVARLALERSTGYMERLPGEFENREVKHAERYIPKSTLKAIRARSGL